MRALTIWQPWASLIMAGAKPIEWRSHHRCGTVVGQRIVIHAGMRPHERIEIAQLRMALIDEGRKYLAGQRITSPTGLDIPIALELLLRAWADPSVLPLGAGLGTAILGEPKPAGDLGFPVDSDRLEHSNWGWPLSDVEVWPEPVPMRGGRGLWTWPVNEFAGEAA
ncbi:hypothetical protein [Sphingomonas jatrophae]|uniref:ASCH domain-containing protein n=1 Tax=Sphingomonas jatrophae TaxID=1166337 RepID=A0A1I6JKV8_9SPHN|nr:hypothetical protein [Sphingomonas jatrophae]SFR79648.1 hypothetical protein SAMN05192580_0428 [Sphingomonas jatrophae]